MGDNDDPPSISRTRGETKSAPQRGMTGNSRRKSKLNRILHLIIFASIMTLITLIMSVTIMLGSISTKETTTDPPPTPTGIGGVIGDSFFSFIFWGASICTCYFYRYRPSPAESSISTGSSSSHQNANRGAGATAHRMKTQARAGRMSSAAAPNKV
jgi:hypothetical protein